MLYHGPEYFEGFCDCPWPCQCNNRVGDIKGYCAVCLAGRHENGKGARVDYPGLSSTFVSMEPRLTRRREYLISH